MPIACAKKAEEEAKERGKGDCSCEEEGGGGGGTREGGIGRDGAVRAGVMSVNAHFLGSLRLKTAQHPNE